MLVLKEPKTKTSVRKVFLPKAVAEMLVERKKMVDELKELLGDEYRDYDLVFASTQGTPTESNFIDRAFTKLIADNHLPKVVFHSLRHTSTTYKLKLSGGDIKQDESFHRSEKLLKISKRESAENKPGRKKLRKEVSPFGFCNQPE